MRSFGNGRIIMHEIYNEEYYKNYDVGTGTVNYAEAEELKAFLQHVAKKIVVDFNPKRVLDAGCATGHLVAALRDLGVEAYGVDISEYAISMVREDIRPYCVVGSLSNPLPESLPKKFDLVITIEVLEHLNEVDGRKAIHNLCQYSDRIVFSSTPDDFEDPTHINVRQREYWARIFAEEGFLDDLNYRPLYLTEYASCFYRNGDWLGQLESYERYIANSDREHNLATERLLQILENKERQIQNLSNVITTMENSHSWSITAPLRKVAEMIRSAKH